VNFRTKSAFLKGYKFHDYFAKEADFRFDKEKEWLFAPYEVKIFWLNEER
jgi:hypothetical protein